MDQSRTYARDDTLHLRVLLVPLGVEPSAGHGVGLASARLSVREDGRVVALEEALD